MKRIMYPAWRKYAGYLLLLTLVLMVLLFPAKAQFRTYTKVYSDNIKGGVTLFGNTLTHIVANNSADTARMNNNRANGNSTYGNDGSNIQFVDIDGNTGAGAGTRNSSSADLALPVGTNNIKMARLYWGARVRRGDYNITLDTFKRVKIRYGSSGNYTEYSAAQMDRYATGSGNTIVYQYQAYVDITPLIQANGSGTYTVGNVPASVGAVTGGGNYAGWCIVVVYENENLADYNSVRVYDGFQMVYDGGAPQISSVTLTGLNVPSGTLTARDAKMGAMVWEGDANLKEDYVKINGINFYNQLNAVDNPWNGTITDTGVHVTTKKPNYTNQMGIDIDQFYVGTGYGIQPADTTVSLEFGTEADRYFPGLFTFQIKTHDPTVIIDKTVQDANRNHVAEPNEILTYTLKGKNVGAGNANYCFITDTLPASVSFIPGSLKVIHCPGIQANAYQTDITGDDHGEYILHNRAMMIRIGTGANATDGGVLEPNEEFEIQYQVQVNQPSQGHSVPPIINMARITGYSDAGIKSTDDGTAILEPLAGPLPVTLKSLAANLNGNNQVKINWTTTMEINCSHYEIERSSDGRMFNKVATLKGGGNTDTESSYMLNDDITSVTASIIYYRLKQVDIDGAYSYSKVVAVKLKKGMNDFMVSPNPFTSYININIEWAKNENATVKVFNISGREMLHKNIQLTRGSNYIALGEIARLPAGQYILQVNTAENRMYKQVTKQ
ncbi:MAG TPA: T9SS type A sorting domain-containing protein [Ferruginibacter sp.]|nr:T9SS type A sorting domain-containing protein [Ferruginibacter sp.]HMP22086.1 T9SS type A sorting domain-containing protein [Ferruginibacter sp.]